MTKNIISGLLGALLSVSIFGLAYVLLDHSLIDKFLPKNKNEVMIYFPMILIAPLSALFVHELGHLLTALALGQKLKLFIVGFFGLKEVEGKVTIFINRKISYFGGVTATAPKTITDINPNTFSKILIAGPIFSLIYFLICLTIFLTEDNVLNSFFALSGITSFGVFLATTVPDKSGIMFTDRKRFQRLNSKNETKDVEIAMYEILSRSIIDNSFKYINIEKTSILEKDTDITIKFWNAYIKFMYYKENEITADENINRNKLIQLKNEIPSNLWKTLNIDNR